MQTEARLQTRVETASANARLLAASTLLRRYARERHALIRPSVIARFESYREAHPEYREVRLLALDGFEDTRLARETLPNVDEEEGDEDWFRSALAADGPSMAVIRSPDDGEPVLVLSRPVVSPGLGSDPLSDPLSEEGGHERHPRADRRAGRARGRRGVTTYRAKRLPGSARRVGHGGVRARSGTESAPSSPTSTPCSARRTRRRGDRCTDVRRRCADAPRRAAWCCSRSCRTASLPPRTAVWR